MSLMIFKQFPQTFSAFLSIVLQAGLCRVNSSYSHFPRRSALFSTIVNKKTCAGERISLIHIKQKKFLALFLKKVSFFFFLKFSGQKIWKYPFLPLGKKRHLCVLVSG